jgi:hypothetical protein
MPLNALLTRIRAEYLEMPGLRLTLAQAQRFCGIDRALCQMVLDALVDEQFLCVKTDGAYARRTDGAISAAAQTDLRPPQRFAEALYSAGALPR